MVRSLFGVLNGQGGMRCTKEVQGVEQWLLSTALLNLFLVALLGVLLRSFPFISGFPFLYKNVLHGHSHFAFGGWVMPALMLLVIKTFPDIKAAVAARHWRNIALLFIVSAYGMLLSFPVQGYGVISIIFSTLSVGAGFYMAAVIWKVLFRMEKKPAHLFLKWGLIFLCISAIGPFATGPLVVMGYSEKPIYYNAIYFYLHFQYNGWFTFALLAVLYKLIENDGLVNRGAVVFTLMNIACPLSFSLSLLWNHPPVVVNMIGGAAAVLQVAGVWLLLADIKKQEHDRGWKRFLLTIALLALALKTALQAVSAFPAVAAMANEQRNFVIAYLHLVLLGFVTLFSFAHLLQGHFSKKGVQAGVVLFVFSFFTTQSLIVLHGLGNVLAFSVPYYQWLLLLCSLPFPAGLFLLWRSVVLSSKSLLLPHRRSYKMLQAH